MEKGLGAKIVVIGGGTGSFIVLSGLKNYASDLVALVSMADDGGSTGQLRDELGVLPPGDVRQCLVALSESPRIRDLFNYRFENGTFEGHSFGNLFLSALEKMTGSFREAISTAGEILRIDGTVMPVTYDNVRLKMSWSDASVTLHGERVIDAEHFKNDPRKAVLSLEPDPMVNPAAIEAIDQADMVVIAPGDLYTSLGPLLVTKGIGDALRRTAGKVVYVCNLVTKDGQTNSFTVGDHAAEIERFGGGDFLDVVLYGNATPPPEVLSRYEAEKAYPVAYDEAELAKAQYTAIGSDFLGEFSKIESTSTPTQVTRGLIRHNPDAVARALMKIYFS